MSRRHQRIRRARSGEYTHNGLFVGVLFSAFILAFLFLLVEYMAG